MASARGRRGGRGRPRYGEEFTSELRPPIYRSASDARINRWT